MVDAVFFLGVTVCRLSEPSEPSDHPGGVTDTFRISWEDSHSYGKLKRTNSVVIHKLLLSG